ncbi:MAG: hypothetical protein ABIP48_31870, partial [Planctomycetota bacterium]
PFGPVEITRQSEEARPDDLASVLKRWGRMIGGKGSFSRIPVAVGLPAGRTYFTTRPIQRPDSDVSPKVLLREALRSPSISVGNMAVDVVKAKPDKRAVASIVACDNEHLATILAGLRECGVQPLRAEPAPCALLRAGMNRHRGRRNAKLSVRIFADDTQALAILVAGKLPVAWRLSHLNRGDEASAILSAIRSLTAVSKDCGIEAPLDAVVLHGRPDLTRLLDVDWIQSQIEVPIEWLPDPPLDSSQVAFGLALGCLNREERAFDLSHSLKRRASLWELFPWREAAVQVGLILLMLVCLADRYRVLSDSYGKIHAQQTEHAWLGSMQEPQLIQEKTDLRQRVAAIEKFLAGRIPWTSYERELAACVPDNMFLTSFEGVCALQPTGKSSGQARPDKSLVLRAAVAIPEDDPVPKEIDRFLDTLRAHEMLKRDFPVVELADLKQVPGTRDRDATASFTVVCLPGTGKMNAE